MQSEREFSGATITSDVFVYLHADKINTPRLATDGSGDVVWRWDSDAFGEGDADLDPDSDNDDVSVRLRFAGQYYDDETGLHYNYFRDYDPATGRYLESDPSGNAGGLNLYVYATNPISLVDPFGQQASCPLPSYEPSRWNDGGRIQYTNNCYSYAWNRPESPPGSLPRPFPDKPQPGGFSGRTFTRLTCRDITRAAIRDGMSRPDDSGECPSCTHKVFLVIAPGLDYHWYRQDSDGSWSHKPGWTEATNVDASGSRIWNPETADRDYGAINYSRECGYLCVPN